MYKFEQFILKSSCSVYAVICILVFCGNNALKSSLKLQMAASACIFGICYFGFSFAFGFGFASAFALLLYSFVLLSFSCIAANTLSIVFVLRIKFTLLCLLCSSCQLMSKWRISIEFRSVCRCATLERCAQYALSGAGGAAHPFPVRGRGWVTCC